MQPFRKMNSVRVAEPVTRLIPLLNHVGPALEHDVIAATHDHLLLGTDVLPAVQPQRRRRSIWARAFRCCCVPRPAAAVCLPAAPTFYPCFWFECRGASNALMGVLHDATHAVLVDFNARIVVDALPLHAPALAHAAWVDTRTAGGRAWTVVSALDVNWLVVQQASAPPRYLNLSAAPLLRVPYTRMYACGASVIVVQTSYGGGVWATCVDLLSGGAQTVPLVHEQPTQPGMAEAVPALACCTADELYVCAHDPPETCNLYVVSLLTWSITRWFPLPWSVTAMCAGTTPNTLRVATAASNGRKIKTLQLL